MMRCVDASPELSLYFCESRLFCLSVCLSVCLSACLPACLSVCLPACLPACLSACLSVPPEVVVHVRVNAGGTIGVDPLNPTVALSVKEGGVRGIVASVVLRARGAAARGRGWRWRERARRRRRRRGGRGGRGRGRRGVGAPCAHRAGGHALLRATAARRHAAAARGRRGCGAVAIDWRRGCGAVAIDWLCGCGGRAARPGRAASRVPPHTRRPRAQRTRHGRPRPPRPGRERPRYGSPHRHCRTQRRQRLRTRAFVRVRATVSAPFTWSAAGRDGRETVKKLLRSQELDSALGIAVLERSL